jgi:uncharacterized delta-60 repeat protein
MSFFTSVVVQADGKIVAVGTDRGPRSTDFFMARYNADGSLDDGGPNDSTPGDSFGTGGKVLTDFGAEDVAHSVALQADGKIVLAGSSVDGILSQFALARYDSNGSPDADFDADGKVVTDFSGTSDARSMALQADGKIVVAGDTGTGVTHAFALARFNPDGSLDSTGFGSGGKVVTDFGAGFNLISSIVLQADGKILAGGATDYGGGEVNFALARYNPDGNPDTSFNFDAKVATDFTGSADLIGGIVLQPDGKIVAAGWTTNPDGRINFALARYLGDPANQSPVISNQTFSAKENSPNGRVVGAVSASDPDAGQTLSYEITAGNAGGAFAINSSTGELTVANSAALDFETTPTFTLTVRVTDNGSPALSGTATITITLRDVNEAPVNSVPWYPQVVTKHKPFTFSSARGNALSVSDPDAGTTVLQVTLTVQHGTLTLARTAGLTFPAGDGVNDRTMTFQGSLSVINAALNGLSYSPDRGYVGSDALTITSNDLGSGLGDPLSTTDVVAILVQEEKKKGK